MTCPRVLPGCRFKKVMSCNRGEIAIRLFRAGLELGMRTVRPFLRQSAWHRRPHLLRPTLTDQADTPVRAMLS